MATARSCIVIGDAAAALGCARIARERGLALHGVVTGDPRLAAWAARASVPCCFADPHAPLGAADLVELSAERPLDFLFSVHNLRLLDEAILALPRALAVNYHDALLPRYAGLHATTWAILAGEREHGITWHRMVERLDAGEILLQRRLAVAPEETAWTLNARCTEAALASFPELLDLLLRQGRRTHGAQQDPAQRTYFAGWRRPTPGGIVPWDRGAATVSAFVRCLDFGPSDQPLGSAKILCPAGAFVVAEVDVLAHASDEPPGSVVDVGPDGCAIATAGADVRLRTVTDLGGGSILPAEQAARMGLVRGDRIAVAAPHSVALAARERAWGRHESTWQAVLESLAPLSPPLPDGADAVVSQARVELPAGLRVPHRELGAEDLALAAVLAWLAHETGEPLDVAFGEPATRHEIAAHGWSGLWESRPPLRAELPLGSSLETLARTLRATRLRRAAIGTYALDLPARSRRLRGMAGPLRPAVAVDLLQDGCTEPPAEATEFALTVVVEPATGTCALSGRGAAALAERCADFLELAAARLDTPLPPRRGASAEPEAGASNLLASFCRVANATPDAVAIDAPARRLTYGELHDRSARLARALRRRGVDREQCVALRFDGASALADTVTAMLAVLRAGAAFLVLDARDPPPRLDRILAVAQPVAIVEGEGLQSLEARSAARLNPVPIALADAPERSAGALAHAAIDRDPAASDLAYVAFTSGSTGEPKGVAVEQAAIAGYVAAARERFSLGPGDRLLQIGSLAFDLAYEQIFVTLGSGATLVEPPAKALPPTHALLAQCGALTITALDLPTALFERMARDIERQALELPRALGLVVIGGENGSTRAARAWRAAGRRPFRLLNTYGPTEATIVATWRELGDREALGALGDSLPIGRPVPGAEAWVLDRERMPVVRGAPGELWLGGPGLARGYHRRPALTAERFAALSCAAGRRLYRTGDRVRQVDDGDLEFLGRLDRQVKIAGRRVELGEIEAALLRIPRVLEAAVAARAIGDGPFRLVAWVVLAPNGTTLDAVQEEAARQLPAALLPVLERVAALPRSASHKIDRAAMDAAAALDGLATDAHGASRPTDRAVAPPRDAIERRLAAIWRTFLGGPLPSRDADFFALGADSLAAVGLLAEIEHQLGRRIGMSTLLQNSTLAGLAEVIRGAESAPRGRGGRSTVIPMQPLGDRPPIFCAHGLGGHLLRLRPLAASLAPDQPFFGLESPGLDDEEPVPPTVEELAARFLGDIRARHDGGPLHLAGMSYGGVVALEIARLATETGQPVACLAMLDTELAEILPAFRPPIPSALRRAKARLWRFAGDLRGLARRRLRRLRGEGDQARKANEYLHFARVQRLNDRALRGYRPTAYTGPVTFFAATPRDPAIYRAFTEAIGCALELIPVGGDHLGMLEPPHVATLAEELRKLVERAAGHR